MSRVRNVRTGRWIELPNDDGMVRIKTGRLVTPQQWQDNAIGKMSGHDNATPAERWFANYCKTDGNAPYNKIRPGWQPDKTTPTRAQFMAENALRGKTFEDLGL